MISPLTFSFFSSYSYFELNIVFNNVKYIIGFCLKLVNADDILSGIAVNYFNELFALLTKLLINSFCVFCVCLVESTLQTTIYKSINPIRFVENWAASLSNSFKLGALVFAKESFVNADQHSLFDWIKQITVYFYNNYYK